MQQGLPFYLTLVGILLSVSNFNLLRKLPIFAIEYKLHGVATWSFLKIKSSKLLCLLDNYCLASNTLLSIAHACYLQFFVPRWNVVSAQILPRYLKLRLKILIFHTTAGSTTSFVKIEQDRRHYVFEHRSWSFGGLFMEAFILRS